jgi:hypothetical protein
MSQCVDKVEGIRIMLEGLKGETKLLKPSPTVNMADGHISTTGSAVLSAVMQRTTTIT